METSSERDCDCFARPSCDPFSHRNDCALRSGKGSPEIVRSQNSKKQETRRRGLSQSDLHEREARSADFLLRVLVSIGQTRKAGHLHDDDRIALFERDVDGTLRDLDLESEADPRRVQGSLVRRVHTEFAARQSFAYLIRGQVVLDHDHGAGGKHRGRESETKINAMHGNLLKHGRNLLNAPKDFGS